MKKIFVFSLVISFIVFPFLSRSAMGQSEFDAGGVGALRIEEEDKIFVPLDKEQEVWDWLYQTYVEDSTVLQKIDPSLAATYSREDFLDVYFDTPDLKLLEQNNGVRHRTRLNLTNNNDQKSGRELVQIKVSGVSNNKLQRGEYKFDVEHLTKITNRDDSHPLLGIIKLNDRSTFKRQMAKLGVEATKLKPILSVPDERNRIYFTRNGVAFSSISFDHVRSELMGMRVEFVEIEPEISEIGYTNADETERQRMEQDNNQIIAQIKSQFSYLESDLTPKYNKTFNLFEKKLPWLRVYIHYGDWILTGLTVLILAVLILISLVVKKIKSKNKYD